MQLKHMRPYQLRDYVEAGHPLLMPGGLYRNARPAYGHRTRHDYRRRDLPAHR